MTRFRMICPDCGAIVLSPAPQMLIWELCPGCRRHVWDADDAMMADIVSGRTQDSDARPDRVAH